MKDTLTHKEAFMAMKSFLEKFYEETNSEDVGVILGELSSDIWQDGSTGDPACWDEWIKCIEKVTSK